MPPKKRKAELQYIYSRVIKVYKSDSDITYPQIKERFGIGSDIQNKYSTNGTGDDLFITHIIKGTVNDTGAWLVSIKAYSEICKVILSPAVNSWALTVKMNNKFTPSIICFIPDIFFINLFSRRNSISNSNNFSVFVI